jgi:hypothetical protein
MVVNRGGLVAILNGESSGVLASEAERAVTNRNTPPTQGTPTSTPTPATEQFELTIESTPKGAKIDVDRVQHLTDGKPTLTPATIRLSKGEHTITLSHPSHKPFTRRINLDEDLTWTPKLP